VPEFLGQRRELSKQASHLQYKRNGAGLTGQSGAHAAEQQGRRAASRLALPYRKRRVA
jgi:hypothetical protein